MLRCLTRFAGVTALTFAAVSSLACQNPTEADDTIDYDDVIVVTSTPDPINAEPSTDGRTYRVTRNDQPDDILAFDWHAIFTVNVHFNSDALDDDIDVDFPVRLTSTSLVVKQAVGGVITPPTGSAAEHYDFAPVSASGNMFNAVDNPVSMTLETWYDLPSLRKEAVVIVTFSFVDDDGVVFQKAEEIRVAP
jgi:hypothetical protein